ncbi:hypothetical protein LG943_09730 [Streptomonospora sp. S1-112]|uniref:Uncharacterized protein n=1 Tax=Streptomonospora mangrovi TaxID=2883123 RepID=A0A9X3NUW5_9ACTN|nr:hypothetical protein [Streptomonospora mangrovi]MDA0564606.1 hypothetical protein [Streptomonospora mangrovi]
MTERIEGQVAKVLNLREIVINRGSNHGVHAGMKFAVLNRHGADIIDPETGEELDSIEIEKTVVKIVRLMPRSSVGRTFRTYRTAGGPLHFTGLSDLANPPITKVETLKTDESTYKEEVDESETYVKTGDPVVQVINEEFSD